MLVPPPPSALPDPQSSWGGSVNGWAPPTPPPPPIDKDMTQISNRLFMFLAQVASNCLDFIFMGPWRGTMQTKQSLWPNQ